MEGLAHQMAGAPQQSSGAMQGQMPTIEEVVALLMQGIDPEKLVEMGVPQEMIMEAIALLEQQVAAQNSGQQGLAAQAAVGPMG